MSPRLDNSPSTSAPRYWESSALYPDVINTAESLGQSALVLHQLAEGDNSPLGDKRALLAQKLNDTAISLLFKIPIAPRLDLATSQIQRLARQADEIKYVPRENDETRAKAYLGDFGANIMRAAAFGATANQTAEIINKMPSTSNVINISPSDVTVERSRIFRQTGTATISHAVGHLFRKGIWSAGGRENKRVELDTWETKVLEYIAFGFSGAAISRILGTGKGLTGEIRNLVEKLGAANEPSAVFIAYKTGVLTPEGERYAERMEKLRLRLRQDLEDERNRATQREAERRRLEREWQELERREAARRANPAPLPPPAPDQIQVAAELIEASLEPKYLLQTAGMKIARGIAKHASLHALSSTDEFMLPVTNQKLLERFKKAGVLTAKQYEEGRVGIEGIALASIWNDDRYKGFLVGPKAKENMNYLIEAAKRELHEHIMRVRAARHDPTARAKKPPAPESKKKK